MDKNELIDLVKERGPNHIAIILDGNGRWAKKRGLSRNKGHKEGSERVIDITEYLDDLGVKYLSLYAFSTENWKRPEDEVTGIMKLLNSFINNELDRLHRKNVKLQIMGDISRLPYMNRTAVNHAVKKTKDNTGLVLNIGLNYGGRAEMVMAVKDIASQVEKRDLDLSMIDETTISQYLYTNKLPDPDLLIRTGGEYRISNFMIYQLAYTEFYFTDTLWPDFDRAEMDKALLDYYHRDRRFGGINE